MASPMLTAERLREEREERERAELAQKDAGKAAETESIRKIQAEAGPRLAASIRQDWQDAVRAADKAGRDKAYLRQPINNFEDCYHAFYSEPVKAVIAEIEAAGFATRVLLDRDAGCDTSDIDFYRAPHYQADLLIFIK